MVQAERKFVDTGPEGASSLAGYEESSQTVDEVSVAFERTVDQGELRLHRSTSSLLATGMVGGIDVGLGVLALLLTISLTHSKALGALAFGTGFIALTLANSELFTENFLVPVSALVTRKAGFASVARLWMGTLVTNLIGGWLIMGVVMAGLPQLRGEAVALGSHFAKQGATFASFSTAVLGGTVITLMTWMQHGTDSTFGRIVAAVASAFLLAAGSLNHAIVASLEMFAGLQAGAPYGYLNWLEVLGWAILGNMAGGILLVTALRLIQVGQGRIEQQTDG